MVSDGQDEAGDDCDRDWGHFRMAWMLVETSRSKGIYEER